MSGPQGPDPTLPWPSEPASGQAQPPPPGHQQPQHHQPPPGQPHYQQPSPPYPQQQGHYPQAPQYQQPPPPYPPQQQFSPPPGGQPPGYPPGAYPRPDQYGPPSPPYQQPGDHVSPPPAGKRGGKKRTLAVIGAVVGVLVVIVAVVLVLGLWKPGFFRTTELNVNSAQSGVQHVLTDATSGYGAKDVKDVKCNDGKNPVVKQGATFTCDVSISGTKRQVTVTFRDDKGTYEVSRPK